MKNNNFMQEALLQAQKALDIDEVPIGAVITFQNKIIAKSFNQNLKNKDCTAHAEIEVLRLSCQKLNSSRLSDCDIYITLEPCLMCATAISLARVKRVYYALADKKFGAYESANGIFTNYPSYHKPEIYSGICESDSLYLMQKFFKSKR